jgi:ABC-type polysaccharide/polyol phosphate export permease
MARHFGTGSISVPDPRDGRGRARCLVLRCEPRQRMPSLPKWSRSLGPLVLADLRRRYAGSVLGGAWALLAPLLEVAAYALVFGWVLGTVRGPGTPYAVLIASGLFPWMWFRESLEGCSTLLPDNRWVRRSRVPAELLVSRLVLASSARALVGLVVVFGYAALSGRGFSTADSVAPFAALVLQALAGYGLGLIAAPVATLAPDSRPTLVSALTLLTFASPILYPESMVRGPLEAVLLWNPFTHLLRLYRAPIEPLAGASLALSLVVASGAAVVSLAGGMTARRRLWWKARDRL